MNELDIKNIWKESGKSDKSKIEYSVDDIKSFLSKRSKSIKKASRYSLRFDVAYKITTILELLIVLIFLELQDPFRIISFIFLIGISALLFFTFKTYKKLDQITETDSVVENMQKQLDYLKSAYKKFIYINGLSTSIFVITSMFAYSLFVHGKIVFETTEDFIVILVLGTIAYILAVVGQLPNFNAQVKELKISVEEFENVAEFSNKIRSSIKRRMLIISAGLVLIFAGLLILFFIINRLF